MFKLVAISLMTISSVCMSEDMSLQMSPNTDHFGCWNYEGARETNWFDLRSLCISGQKASIEAVLSKKALYAKTDVRCTGNGSLSAQGDAGSRLYFFEDIGCEGENSLGALALLCRNSEEEGLMCEELDLAFFATQDTMIFTNEFRFAKSNEM